VDRKALAIAVPKMTMSVDSQKMKPTALGKLGLGGKLASDYHDVLNALWSRMLDLGDGKGWTNSHLATPDPNASSELCQREGHFFTVKTGGKAGNVPCSDCDARRHNVTHKITYGPHHKPWSAKA
jgi:hypothetical protein